MDLNEIKYTKPKELMKDSSNLTSWIMFSHDKSLYFYPKHLHAAGILPFLFTVTFIQFFAFDWMQNDSLKKAK